MSEPIRNIVIVGGGTAGWMTAAQLAKVFEQRIQIRVIESARIGTVGVGEATFNTIKVFFDALGLEEADWMPHCNATYKLAIRFAGWTAHREHFYHPFERCRSVDELTLPEWWLRLRPHNQPLDYACLSTPHLCDRGRAPRYLDGTPFDEHTAYPYAYHFDANGLASFLRDLATRRGVEHVQQDVVDVVMDPGGAIEAVRTADGGRHGADLFIDCTGFRGLLINQALGAPFVSYAKHLLCDRAVAARIPRPRPGHDIDPFTTATALDAGWAWDIPLFDGTGVGYVYSSRFLSAEDAENEFRRHLGRGGKDVKGVKGAEDVEDVEVRHLRMRVGRTQTPWVANCVAIGLSAGFVEPLESTGIFFIQHGIAELLNHFPTQKTNNALSQSYNRNIGDCMDGVRDFLVLHYLLSSRSDTHFWRAAKEEIEVPPALQERLALWRHRLPNPSSMETAYHGFAPSSYVVMLAGLGHLPAGCHPLAQAKDEARARAFFDALAELTGLLGQELPAHGAYLRALYGMERAGAAMHA